DGGDARRVQAGGWRCRDQHLRRPPGSGGIDPRDGRALGSGGGAVNVLSCGAGGLLRGENPVSPGLWSAAAVPAPNSEWRLRLCPPGPRGPGWGALHRRAPPVLPRRPALGGISDEPDPVPEETTDDREV